jgi:16S rRNA (guanine1207-N2)-methyltransferase
VEYRFGFAFMGASMEFETDDQVFSPRGVDAGTLELLKCAPLLAGGKVLDLGCGYGAVGITAAKLNRRADVTMCDSSDDALRLAGRNIALNGVPDVKLIKSDGFNEIADWDYTLILCNPPYHADFSTPKAFIEGGYKKLAYGGKLFLVTKRKVWYKNKLVGVFGGVKIAERNGYCVFMSEKLRRADHKYKKSSEKESGKEWS